MSYRLEFSLEGLPKMANIQNGKSHWRHADKERKLWQQLVAMTVGARKPKEPLLKAGLILTRFSSVEPDYDGLVRGFKSVVDGLTVAGVLANDKLSNTGAWDCRWEKCKPKQGSIRVVVFERGENQCP